MDSFVALYRNQEGLPAKLIAVGAAPGLVAYVSGWLARERRRRDYGDPVAAALERGRLQALRAIRREALELKRKGAVFQVLDGESAKLLDGGEEVEP